MFLHRHPCVLMPRSFWRRLMSLVKQGAEKEIGNVCKIFLLKGKPRALSVVKSPLAWQPVDTVNSVTTSPVQLQACEQRSCLSLLPLDCQEKVQLVGWVKQLFLKKKGGKHIAWLTHHNLERKWIPLLPPEERRDQTERKAKRKEREG